MARQTPVYGWPELAMSAQLMTFGLGGQIVAFVGFIPLAILANFISAENFDQAIETLGILCIAMPAMFVVVVGMCVPDLIKYHSHVLQCLEREPIATDPDDAREVQWSLESFRWMHRLACWFRGRDYAAMLAACERAQVADPDRQLPAEFRERPPLLTFLWKFPNEPAVRDRIFGSWRRKGSHSDHGRDAE